MPAIDLSDDEVRRILVWANVCDGEWGANAADVALVERLVSLVGDEPAGVLAYTLGLDRAPIACPQPS